MGSAIDHSLFHFQFSNCHRKLTAELKMYLQKHPSEILSYKQLPRNQLREKKTNCRINSSMLNLSTTILFLCLKMTDDLGYTPGCWNLPSTSTSDDVLNWGTTEGPTFQEWINTTAKDGGLRAIWLNSSIYCDEIRISTPLHQLIFQSCGHNSKIVDRTNENDYKI